MGITRMIKIVLKISVGFRLTALRMGAVLGFRLPQMERFKGVIKMAAAVETAVMLIETAMLPRAR